MPKTHHLKTLPVYFDAVRRGDKTFEIRKNDRDFQTGDTLVLEEFKGGPPHAPRGPGQPPLTREELGYTGNTIEMRVSYCLHGPAFGLEVGHVVMGLGQPGEDAPVNLDLFSEHPTAPSQRFEFMNHEGENAWLEWTGGDMAVPPTMRVDYKLRNGERGDNMIARSLRWSHANIATDIVAYRIHR